MTARREERAAQYDFLKLRKVSSTVLVQHIRGKLQKLVVICRNFSCIGRKCMKNFKRVFLETIFLNRSPIFLQKLRIDWAKILLTFKANVYSPN